MRSSIEIKVEPFPGSDIDTVCMEVCKLARKMEIYVKANFNGVTLMANQYTDPLKLADEWRTSLNSDRPHKIASA